MFPGIEYIKKIFYTNSKVKNEDFSYKTRLIRWGLVACGMLPIWRGSDDLFHFKWIHPRMMYSVIVYILSVSVFTCITLINRCSKLMLLSQDFDNFIYNAMFLSFGKTQYFFSIAGWLAANKIANYHNMWIDLEKTYCNYYGCTLPLESLELKSNRLMIICIVAILMLIFGQLFTLSTYEIYEAIGYIPSCTACFFYLALVHLHCEAIIIASEHLLKKLKLSLSDRVLTMDTLIMHKCLWVKLSNITQFLGYAFCNYSFIMISGSFIDIIIAGYGYFSHLANRLKSNDNNVLISAVEIGLIIASIVSLYIITHVNNACYKATNKVEEPFVDILCMAGTKPYHPSVIGEIDSFLATIKNNPPIISFGGYIVADRKLITKIIFTIITYLVVLTQFKIGFDQTYKKN